MELFEVMFSFAGSAATCEPMKVVHSVKEMQKRKKGNATEIQ